MCLPTVLFMWRVVQKLMKGSSVLYAGEAYEARGHKGNTTCEQIDPSTLSTTQIIYITKLVFEVTEHDSLTGRNRIGLIQKERDLCVC